jgi:hypothetical protein
MVSADTPDPAPSRRATNAGAVHAQIFAVQRLAARPSSNPVQVATSQTQAGGRHGRGRHG